ncbi:MAG: ribosome silencing factor [Holophagales bacterium]|nr:MAG: ribosome silencing factor [Holophagales bacterium]
MSAGDRPILDTRDRVRYAVAAALDIKAVDLRVRHLAPVTDFVDYFVVCSATNERQAQAIADNVEERLREQGARPLHVEGYPHGQWILVDYGDLILHVFLEERRHYYALERLWADSPDVTAEFAA